MINKAVIIAVGNPHHRSQLTYNRVHAMLPALGKPLVVRIMNRLYRIGIREYVVIVGHQEGTVASYLSNSWMPDVKINFRLLYGHETLTSILKQITTQDKSPFMLCAYNCFTQSRFPESLAQQYEEGNIHLVLSAATGTLSNSPQQYYAEMTDYIVKAIDRADARGKSAHALVNLAMCRGEFNQFIADIDPESLGKNAMGWGFLDLAQKYVSQGGKTSMAETAWALQIETDRDLLTLNRHLLDEGNDSHLLSEVPYTVQITPPVRIDPQVSIGQGARIGPHVYLEKGCSIGRDSVLRNTIVMSKANVPADRNVSDTIITTRGPIR